MVKAREQSKKINYTDPFKIEHITLFIAINFNGSINKIEENWETPTFFIQDGGYLFTS